MNRCGAMCAAAAALFVLCGCSRDGRAEKMYARALREHGAVLRDCTAAGGPQFAAAVQAFKAVVEKYPSWRKSADLQYSVGWMYAARGDLENARGELAALYMYYPQRSLLCSRAVYLIALSHEKQGNWNKARIEYERLIERYPSSPPALSAPLRIAEHFRVSGRQEEYARACQRAVFLYREAIDDDPDGKAALAAQSYLINALGGQGRWGEAADELEGIAARHPSSVHAPLALYRSAMIALRKLDGRDRARALLERVAREYPRSPVRREAELSLGRLLLSLGETGKAKEVFYGVMEANRDAPAVCAAAQLSLAQGYAAAGRGEEALRECEQVNRRFPDTVQALEARLLMAEQYRTAGRAPEAEAAFGKAVAAAEGLIKKQPAGEQAGATWRLLGAAYFFREQWQAGIDALRAFLKACPRAPEAGDVLFTVGTVYLEKLNDARKARYYYTRLVTEFPGHFMAGPVRERLARPAGENTAAQGGMPAEKNP